MRKLLALLAISFALLAPLGAANAATCYWVGGTGNWDNSTTSHWASSSGGTASTCAATGGIPKNTGDTATFDGSSGGGVVTVCGASSSTCPSSAGNLTLLSGGLGGLTLTGYTGTLDFSAINPTVAAKIIDLGSSTYTLKMGSGNWNFPCGGNCIQIINTNMTLTNNGSTINVVWCNGCGNFNLTATGKTLGTVSVPASSTYGFQFALNSNMTIGTLTVTPPNAIVIGSTSTVTITNPISWNGTSTAGLMIFGNNSRGTFSVAAGSAISWAMLQDIAFSGVAVNATNSVDAGNNNMNGGSITPPSGGGGAYFIGGQ